MKIHTKIFSYLLLVLLIQMVCVVFYVFQRGNCIVLSTENDGITFKGPTTTKSRKKDKRHDVIMIDKNYDDEWKDSKDDIIQELQKQNNLLRRDLNRIKKTCNKNTESLSKVNNKTGYDGSRENERMEGTTRVTVENIALSQWIKDEDPFDMFTPESIYRVNSAGLPSEQYSKESLNTYGNHEHLSHAVDEARTAIMKYFKPDSHVTIETGLFRENVNVGVEYELQLVEEDSQKDKTIVYDVRLARFLSSFVLLQSPVKRKVDKLVNIIVPLKGRLEQFHNFLLNFKHVCTKDKENVFLTVVYSGEEGVNKVEKMLNILQKETNFTNYQLLTRKENFNRGPSIHDGVTHWKGDSNVLMFFCDVDVTFDSAFLDRCRTFTKPHRTVYYPLVFNYYNPHYVTKETNKLWRISTKTGQWRNYGYGMTCQHRQDYLRVGGFDLNITGWGLEDVELHRKFITQEGIRVIRAPDSGLSHHYHKKHCSIELPRKQYEQCIGSRINSEASKKQYGKEVFRMKRKLKEILRRVRRNKSTQDVISQLSSL